ncbi:hypothetical protein CHU92_01900 [Flavobacterium cyanobacteriorum]|uniref:Adhesin domain-containing protein n=2 Tax=Flavobacterium cyanobacteriorum TaxID=2022802 RepID=A0A255ZVZ0_9FLAO|nr:hypothetical protein CHU92_01900 [Flavobacterium cyanobacteriorum]
MLLLLLLPALASAVELKGKYKKEKNIRKSYQVNSNAALDINNKYGTVYVATWDQNITEIDITIKVAGDDEKQVTQRINSIDVSFSATKALVTAVTKIGNLTCNSNISMEINYTIKIPKKGSINLDNEYGGIQAGKIYGKADINCQYGDVGIDELHNDVNLLKIQYCGNSKINFAKAATINAKYSGLRVGKSNNVEFKGEYSNLSGEDINTIQYTSDYGEIKIKSAGVVTGKGDYNTIRFGRIYNTLNLTTNYGDIKIELIDKTTRNIAINANYTGISLGFDDSYPFDFELTTEYSDITGTEGFKFTTKKDKEYGSGGYYKGYHKNSGSNKLFIKSKYGHIQLVKK